MSTRQHHGRIIDTSIRLRTSPDRAWAAWADPEHIANWFVDRAEGHAAPGEVMTWFFDAFNYRQPVPIVEAEPGRSFVVGSGDAPGPQGHPYLMEITIAHDGGETTLRLVNSGFSEDARFDDEYEGVVSGWKMALGTLKAWLERYPGRGRVHHFAMQPATFAPERLRPLFTTADGRRSWLTDRLTAEAAPLEHTAAALVDTGREVLLDWPSESGVLGLKAFRMGPQQVLALDLSAWPSPSDAMVDPTPRLRESLARLAARLA